jgi:hypothetical protein
MRSLRRLAFLIAVICASVSAAAPAAQARVFIPSCGVTTYGGRVEPPRWDAGCTGTPELIRAKWTGWGRDVAIGRGFTVFIGCGPDCASSEVYEYRSRLRVSRVRRCKSSTGALKRFYTRGTLRFRVPDGDDSGIREGLHVVGFPFQCVR